MAWYNSSWLNRKKITINQTNIDNNLTDFPVFVSLADSDILAGSKANLDDVLFTSADGETKLSHEIVKQRFAGAGGWCWFSNPRAIFHNGTNKKVFVGSIDGSGNLYVGELNHSTGFFTQTQLTSAFEIDDHDNPSLVVRPSDNKIVAFYAKHDGDTLLRYKISTNTESSALWGAEQTVAFNNLVSYANPVVLEADSNACYVFCRVNYGTGRRTWEFVRTTDYVSWGVQTKLWDAGPYQMYLHCAKNGTDRIDFFVSDRHPDNSSGDSSLYHFYAKWDAISSTLKYYNSNGIEQTLPIDTTKATLVFAGSSGVDSWNHQIAIDSSGYPRVLFQKRVSTIGTGDNRLMFSRWNGFAWVTPVEITNLGGYVYAGELSYTGNGCFDGSDINKVYLGKQVDGVYELQEWATTDNGATWTKSRDITTGSDSGLLNIRPFSPVGHEGKMACIWVAGSYTSYTAYNMSLYCDPPIVNSAYVKVPTVSGSVDTDIYIYYGNNEASAQESVATTWDNGYKAVHHLDLNPAKIALTDSTSNAKIINKKSLSEPSNRTQSAQYFDGVDDYLNFGSGLNLAAWTEFTAETLINYLGTGDATYKHTLISNWTVDKTTAGIMLRVSSSAAGSVIEGFAVKQADTQIGGSFGISVTPNQTEFVAMVYDSTNLKGYVNSVQGATTYTSGASLDSGASAANMLVGNSPHIVAAPYPAFAGTIFELRISNVARSAAWLKASAINLKTPTTFYSTSVEEVLSTDANVSGNLVAISLSILLASASGNIGSNATGALPQLTLSTLTATTSVSSGAVASGSFQQINLSVVTGIASSETGQVNASSSGAFSNITLSTLSGTASYEGQYPNVIQDFGPKTIQIIT